MSKSKKILFLCLFLTSGFCGLVYEIVWGRLLSFVFGGSTFAVTTVLACFMGGLAIGSLVGGRLGCRVRNPVRTYGFLEIGIGFYCLLVPSLVQLALPLYQVLAGISGQSFLLLTVARVLVCVVILIVPSILMGATLPLLSKAFSDRSSELGGAVATLYGFNTIGAFFGCVSVGCFLLPVLGLSKCIMLAAALNILAGLTAVAAMRGKTGSSESLEEYCNGKEPLPSGRKAEGLGPKVLLWLCGICGFVSMGYQVAWIRALILVMGASTYAFSVIVACFIFGIAVGSLLISKYIDSVSRPLTMAGVLAGVIGLYSILVLPCLQRMVWYVAKLARSADPSFSRILGMEAICVFGLLLVPTICMGVLLPLFCRIYRDLRLSGRPERDVSTFASSDVGTVYASNTAGSVIGIVLTGFVLIPCSHFGMQYSIMLLSVLSVFVGTVLLLADSAANRWINLGLSGALLTACLLSAVTSGSWSKKEMMSAPYLGRSVDFQEEIIFYEEGIDCTVSVSSVGKTSRTLRINGKPDASTRISDMCSQILMAQIPLFLRPESRDVCVIGLGSGVTADAVLANPVNTVDVPEISSSVIKAAGFFSQANKDVLRNPRLKVFHEDGRNFLLLGKKKYDVIISEPSNVWISGIANLYSREFLEIAERKLKPGGMYCFWIHSYSMRRDDFAGVLNTMMSVFPHVQLWSMTFGDYLVIGSGKSISMDLESIGLVFARPEVKTIMNSIGIDDPVQLAYYYVANGNNLAKFAEGQRVLVDDVPYLEYSAPRYLLKNDAMQIVEAILGLDAEPSLAGGSESLPGRNFIDKVRMARKARRCLNESVRAANSGDGMKVLNSFLLAAQNTPDDRRVLSVIEKFFEEKIGIVDPKTKAVMEQFYAQIVKVAPRIKTIRLE